MLGGFLQIVDIMFSIVCMQIWESYLVSPLRCITWIRSVKIPIDTYSSQEGQKAWPLPVSVKSPQHLGCLGWGTVTGLSGKIPY